MPASAPVPIDADPEVAAALEEIQRMLDTPLAGLMETEEERAAAEELTRQALGVPAMTRLRELVAFVGGGRPATQAGNLKPVDAVAVAVALDTRDAYPATCSMDDLPGVAHVFRWATAAEFLAKRGTKVVAGPCARDLERDPLAAWLKAATTLLEHGLLDGFRRGWRKRYVELIDAEVGDLLAAMLEAGGALPLGAIGDRVWGQVARGYGFDVDDDDEHRHVIQLVGAMVAQLTDIGMVTRDHDDVVLTGLGNILATAAGVMASDDKLDELDLVDTDAQSLLLVCAEEMEPADASGHLLAWCQARPADEAAEELCEAMLDDDDPSVWRLGLEALAMLDRAVAEPAVRRLRSHPGLRPVVAEWQRRHGQSA